MRIKDETVLKRLKPPRNPEGGWLPPKMKELNKFFEEMQEEAIRRFGVDEDNDACVIVRLIDNSRQESNVLNFEPVPRDIEESPYHPYGKKKWEEGRRDPISKKYIWPKHTPAEEETRTKAILENRFWIQRMVLMNWEIASERLKQLNRDIEYTLRKEIEAPEIKRANRIKELKALKEKWTDVFAYYEKKGCYEIDREARTYWYKDEARSGEDKHLGPAKRYQISDKPKNFDVMMSELDVLLKYKPAREIEF